MKQENKPAKPQPPRDRKEVEKEIKRLQGSAAVRLAQKEIEMQNAGMRERALQHLQELEARGLELQVAGVTEETLAAHMASEGGEK
jgi:hypothetical protein